VRLAVGIDLHGTLMEDREYVRPELLGRLVEALSRVKSFSRLYVCTGNDLSFVKRKVPAEILSLFDGLVLEHGCVLSFGDDERVQVPAGTVGRVKALEASLKSYDDPELYKFDRRLTSAALFTRWGFSPAEYMAKIAERVRLHGGGGLVYVTHSSVAVDVVPLGYTKASGLRAVAAGLPTVAVADSMNDVQLHLESAYSFAPSNISGRLKAALEEAGRAVSRLSEAEELGRGVTYVADWPATEGVIQVLNALSRIR